MWTAGDQFGFSVVVAEGLVPNWYQAISNDHADSTLTTDQGIL